MPLETPVSDWVFRSGALIPIVAVFAGVYIVYLAVEFLRARTQVNQFVRLRSAYEFLARRLPAGRPEPTTLRNIRGRVTRARSHLVSEGILTPPRNPRKPANRGD